MPARSRILWNLDPTLRDLAGHHYAYATALGGACARRQWRIVTVANRQCAEDVRQSLAAEPFFRDSIHAPGNGQSRLGHLREFLRSNARVYADLTAFDASRFAPEDIALFHTVSHRQLLGIWRWQRGMSSRNRPHIVLLLRYDPRSRDATGMQRWRGLTVLYWLALLPLRHAQHVHVATDSDRLAAIYSRLGVGRRIAVLPIPHVHGNVKPTLDAHRLYPPAVAPKLVFAGDARREKGIALIAQVAPPLARARAARFVIQCNHDDVHADDVLDEIRALAAVGEGVTLVRQALDEDAYVRLLEDANAVILPYDPCVYGARTSGVFAEAMALGKPVITTRDTWMGEEAERCGFGELLMEEWTAQALHRAIERFIAAPQRWSDLARMAAGRWCERHSAERYLDILEEITATG